MRTLEYCLLTAMMLGFAFLLVAPMVKATAASMTNTAEILDGLSR
jgi:hypothetical protein